MGARADNRLTAELFGQDQFIPSTDVPNLTLRLRERRPTHTSHISSVPLLLVHGATFASILWDNPLSEWSWMNRLAAAGFHVFALDLRGYGLSSRPAHFAQPPSDHRPYARACEVQGDLKDAIGHIRRQTGASKVDLLGGSWGSIVCGMFAASEEARSIRRLVLYAPIYAEPDADNDWLKMASDPAAPSQIRSDLGSYRHVNENQLRARWDSEIPHDDKTIWRSDAMFQALFDGCIAEDSEGGATEPPSFRAPNGTLVDLFTAFSGTPLFDAAEIAVPTFLIRGDSDPTSTHGDTSRLFSRLGASRKRHCTIGHGAHFVVLERGMMEVHQEVTGFLRANFEAPGMVLNARGGANDPAGDGLMDHSG